MVEVYGASPAARGESQVLAGVIVGAVLAVAWALLVYFTHNPVSLAGWAVGGLIGITQGFARAFDLSERIYAEAHARDSAATPAERERLVRMYADNMLGRERFLPMLGRLFGLWDLLWLGLGASSAWKLAERGMP